MRLPNKGIY